MPGGIPLDKKIGFFSGLFRAWAERGYGSGTAYRKYMEQREKIPREYRLRKTDFLRAYREWAGLPKKRETWKYTRYDRKPTEKAIIRTMKHPVREYNFETKVTIKDIDTGIIETRDIRVGSDELLTKSEVTERIIAIFRNTSPKKEVIDIKHIAIFGRKSE